MQTPEAWPDESWLDTNWTFFDESKPDRQSDSRWHTYIGNVHQVEGGPEGGLRAWSVTATFPGSENLFPRSGKEPTRKEAGRQVMDTYERMLKFYGRSCTP